MPFAGALSEHPLASSAVGEVAGAVLESIGDRPDLVMITVTRAHAGALEDIVDTVTAVLHPLATIGCAAETVVGTSRHVEGAPAVSLWAGRTGPLAQVQLTATRLADDSWHFAGLPDPVAFPPSALVLLADPFTFPVGDFLAWLAEAHPGLTVVGGTVTGARGPGGNRLVVGDRVVTTGATGVLIGGGVDIRTVVAQGCRPYGMPLTVTRSDRNVIYEVAGSPALERMVDQIQGGLDPTDVAALQSHGLLVGLLIDERAGDPGPGDYLVREVVGVDRATGAMAVDARVPLGSTVRFHVRDPASAHQELLGLLDGHQPEAAMVFAGTGRGSRLSEYVHQAHLITRSIGPVPSAGFVAAGGIGPIGGRNFLHGTAASVALFRERCSG